MSEEVEVGEEDGEGLLHAEKAVERPFAVELVDWVQLDAELCNSLGRDNVLAGVVTFGWACPEKQAVVGG